LNHRVKDALGSTATFAYDAVGNMVQTTDAVGNVVTATYDLRGPASNKQADARGSGRSRSPSHFDEAREAHRFARPSC
jgi:YD repeat-containing protein